MKKKIFSTSIMLGSIFTLIILIAASLEVILTTKIPKSKEWYEVPEANIASGIML